MWQHSQWLYHDFITTLSWLFHECIMIWSMTGSWPCRGLYYDDFVWSNLQLCLFSLIFEPGKTIILTRLRSVKLPNVKSFSFLLNLIGEKFYDYNFASKGWRGKNFNQKNFCWKTSDRETLKNPMTFHDFTFQLLLIHMFSNEIRIHRPSKLNSVTTVLEYKMTLEILHLMWK